MTTQFLDSRLSLNNTSSSGTEPLTTTPTLFGDIGLQTVNAIGTPNVNDVRIQLWGMVGVYRSEANAVDIIIERGGTGVVGSGILIFSLNIELSAGPGHRDLTQLAACSTNTWISMEVQYPINKTYICGKHPLNRNAVR